jgi:glycosyltransferase involved in cell wall biosynthesis
MLSKACITGIYQRKLVEIAQCGVELTVAVPPGWRDERGWLPLERAHTEGYDLRVTPMAFNGRFHLHFYPRLRSLLSEVQPDLLHVDEEPYNLATWHAVRLGHRLHIPTLFFAWQNLLRRYPPPFSWIEQNVYRLSAYAIAGNQDAVDVLRAKGYAGPLCVIPQFGIDPALYSRAVPPAAAPPLETPPAEAQPFVIGYAGRLVPEKGIADLLAAVAQLPGNWQVRLLGSGPDRDRLDNLAHTLGIADRVRFEGQVPSGEMPDHLAQLHALVLPSHSRPNWVEQFGRVLVEAMACGVPVIGSDSGEIPNVIGDAGLVYPEGEVDALRQQIESLMNDPDRWMIIAQSGCDRAQTHYSQAQVAARTVEAYRYVLEGSSSSS